MPDPCPEMNVDVGRLESLKRRYDAKPVGTYAKAATQEKTTPEMKTEPATKPEPKKPKAAKIVDVNPCLSCIHGSNRHTLRQEQKGERREKILLAFGENGRNIRQTAKALRVGRNTVRRVIRESGEK